MDIILGLLLIVVSLANLPVECRKLSPRSGYQHTSTCPCSKRQYEWSKRDFDSSSQDLSDESFRYRERYQSSVDFIKSETCGCGCRRRIKVTKPPVSTTEVTYVSTVEATTIATTVPKTELPTTTAVPDEITSVATEKTSGYTYNRTCNDNSTECTVVVSYPNLSDVTLKYKCWPPGKCGKPVATQQNSSGKENKEVNSSSDRVSSGTVRPSHGEQLTTGGIASGSSNSRPASHSGYSIIGNRHHSNGMYGGGAAVNGVAESGAGGSAGSGGGSGGGASGGGLGGGSAGSGGGYGGGAAGAESETGGSASFGGHGGGAAGAESETGGAVGNSTSLTESETVAYGGSDNENGGKQDGQHPPQRVGGYSHPRPSLVPREGRPTTTEATVTELPETEDEVVFPKNILSPPACGVFNETLFGRNKITGGLPSITVGKWPWVAALGYEMTPGSVTWACGGVLVTAKSVITAAHCLDHPSMRLQKVRFGDLDLDDNEDGATPIDVEVERTIKHSRYNKRRFNNDIAIVIVKQPVVFTDTISPICLPFGLRTRSEMFTDMNPYIVGWGYLEFHTGINSMLYEAQVPVVPNYECNKIYSEQLKREVKSTHICAGGNGKDTCQGDSGGPLMVPWKQANKPPHFYTVGVVSWGYRCGTVGYPGVYTRITSYLDWLEKNLV